MRSRIIIGILFCLLLLGVPGMASPMEMREPQDGYVASDNVEFLGSIELMGLGGGARKVGNRLYVTSSGGLQIFDVSDPRKPRELGRLALTLDPSAFAAAEDVDTNGKVLVVRGAFPASNLYVIDVSDPTSPEVAAEVLGAGDHTTTCVLRCTYAYGSGGAIIDLRTPSKARIVGDWLTEAGVSGAHDLTEIRPGVLVTASSPALFLFAGKDPLNPVVVGAAELAPDGDLFHQVAWPRRGRDRYLLGLTENQPGVRCGEVDRGEFLVWDAAGSERGQKPEVVGSYSPDGGVLIDGRPPVNPSGCGHWFDPHATFRDGGTVAIAWYEHGVRFLSVADDGSVGETGYFMPIGGATADVDWVSGDIVYATDYNTRGLDILRLKS